VYISDSSREKHGLGGTYSIDDYDGEISLSLYPDGTFDSSSSVCYVKPNKPK
jgi:hypothetical protein